MIRVPTFGNHNRNTDNPVFPFREANISSITIWIYDSMQLKKTRHAVYNLNYHLVWILKYRRKKLFEPVCHRLNNILYEIAESKGLEILGVKIMLDHIHLFISAPPQHSPSLLVNWFKDISARKYNRRYNDIKIKWTRSYYAGTAGTVTSETIKKCIEEQKHENQKDY